MAEIAFANLIESVAVGPCLRLVQGALTDD